MSAVRPTVEYGSEVWEGNKSQAGRLCWVEQRISLGALQRLVMRQLGSGNITGFRDKASCGIN